MRPIPPKSVCRKGPKLNDSEPHIGVVVVKWHDVPEGERVVPDVDSIIDLCATASYIAIQAVASVTLAIIAPFGGNDDDAVIDLWLSAESRDADDDDDNVFAAESANAEEGGAPTSWESEYVPSKHGVEVDATVVLPSEK